MTAVGSFNDQQGVLLLTTGKWTWKDDTNTLDFISTNPATDRQDRQRRRPKGGVHFQDIGSKKNDRIASGVGSRSYGMGRGRGQGMMARSPKPGHKQQGINENTLVTLADVKCVAIDMLSEVESISPDFEGMFGAGQFDEFLIYLLNFFNCFFEKKTQAEKHANQMYIEPSLAERMAYVDACAKLEVAQKQLGQAYCILVLGMGIEKQHHMKCGDSRVSSTYKDRSMYETLYSFLTFVVWITFRRRDYENVKKEVGRMLRSDTFNPAIRVKNAVEPELAQNGRKKEKPESRKLTAAEYRRSVEKRPAIKSIINQRSPALVSILPSPKEEVHWLFKKSRPVSPNSLGKVGKDEEEQKEGLQVDVEDEAEQTINLNKFKIGIIGEPISQFNPVTLLPLGSDADDEEHEDSQGAQRESSIGSTPGAHRTSQGISRQATAISTATTEAVSDEDD